MPRPMAFDGFPDELRCDYGPYMAVADEGHDGDTVAVILDPGWDESPCRWLRLKDVWAAELSQEYGYLLRDYLAEVFPPGTHCKVVSEKTPRSKDQKMTFNRYVSVVYLSGGRVLNDIINAKIQELMTAQTKEEYE